jgi:rhodanese-related sulfurtransferase
MTPTHKHHNQGFLDLVGDAKSRIREVGIEELRKMLPPLGQFLLIDTREESEWAAGHAAGAVQLGKGIIERDIETLAPNKNQPMVLYCGGGFRSALAADALQKMGYTCVASLAGGWRDYVAAGLPVEK